MTDNEDLDPRKLTFSQAQGYEPIPGPLALGLLSEEARIRLWDCLVAICMAWILRRKPLSVEIGALLETDISITQ